MERNVIMVLVLFGLGVWYFFWDFMRLCRKRMIENISTPTIRGLALGLVELVGKATRKLLFKSSLCGVDCVAYRHTIERETLEKITAARTACLVAKTVGESFHAEGELAKGFKTLFAVAENYPDLKANQSFVQLQQRISYLESQIADRREFFNDSVNNYNIRISQIPDMFVANMLQMKPKEMFNALEEEKKDVDIKFDAFGDTQHQP